ncbi:hypothetical protein BJX63DRAFT_400329 [Aspergillus granulosus]|uniref:Phenol hydroxylase-like C-terminal dimerisation domain-containing protein n=1 Tax=Aspergillus granulosus TaxID=176169 RepID=A0ABR4H6K3_9EURO
MITVHTAPRSQVDIFDCPEAFRPYDEIDGWDYEKIFIDDILSRRPLERCTILLASTLRRDAWLFFGRISMFRMSVRLRIMMPWIHYSLGS